MLGVMNIINGFARRISPCVRAPPSLAAEERMLWAYDSMKVVCAECMKMCCLGGKNSVVNSLPTNDCKSRHELPQAIYMGNLLLGVIL